MTQEFVTLPREVAQQALEALEEADLLMEHRQNVELRRSALVTLHAALEAQVEQEPVAWLHRCNKKPTMVELSFNKREPELASKGYKAHPLYIHPQPKREPLTDEHIEKICPSFDDPMRREMWKIGFKAAHNIE
jgi:hypothetical protein